MLAVTDKNFSEVLGAPLAIVDFWHPECTHCVDFKPVIEQVANEYNDSVLIVGARVDQCKKSADGYDIDGLPALVFFREGQEVHRTEGEMSREQLKALIAQKLGA